MQDGAQNETGQAEAIAFLENGAGIRSGANRVDIHGAIVSMIDDRDYLQEALNYLDPPAPVLLAIGGLSDSGKTTIAQTIAHCIGASLTHPMLTPGSSGNRSGSTLGRSTGSE